MARLPRNIDFGAVAIAVTKGVVIAAILAAYLQLESTVDYVLKLKLIGLVITGSTLGASLGLLRALGGRRPSVIGTLFMLGVVAYYSASQYTGVSPVFAGALLIDTFLLGLIMSQLNAEGKYLRAAIINVLPFLLLWVSPILGTATTVTGSIFAILALMFCRSDFRSGFTAFENLGATLIILGSQASSLLQQRYILDNADDAQEGVLGLLVAGVVFIVNAFQITLAHRTRLSLARPIAETLTIVATMTVLALSLLFFSTSHAVYAAGIGFLVASRPVAIQNIRLGRNWINLLAGFLGLMTMLFLDRGGQGPMESFSLGTAITLLVMLAITLLRPKLGAFI